MESVLRVGTVAIRRPCNVLGRSLIKDILRASVHLYFSGIPGPPLFSPSCRGQDHQTVRGKHLSLAHLLFQEYGLVFGNSPVTHGAARPPPEFVRGWPAMPSLVTMHLVRAPFRVSPQCLIDTTIRYGAECRFSRPVFLLTSDISVDCCCHQYLKGEVRRNSSCISYH